MTAPKSLCATCAYFDRQPATPVGLCRFLPPTAFGLPMQKHGLDGKVHVEMQQVNMWANTRPEDWCAQHTLAQQFGLAKSAAELNDAAKEYIA